MSRREMRKVYLQAADRSWERVVYGDTDDVIRAIELGLKSFGRGFDLTGYVIQDLPLRKGDYRRSKFIGAKIKFCNMAKGRFDLSNFDMSSLNWCVGTSCNLQRSQITFSIWNACDFTDADFRDADLSKSVFKGCLFRGCRFDGASVARSEFINCDMRDSVFVGSDLSDVNMNTSNTEGMKYVPAELTWEDAEDWKASRPSRPNP